MEKTKFSHIMRLAAFLAPFYFVFYVPPDESDAKMFSRFILAGFLSYAL